jgi:hypothetical protein
VTSYPRFCLLTVVVAAVAGCTGEFTPDNGASADAGPDQAAREAFATDLVPIMMAKCNSCHLAGQVGAPKFSTYDEIVAHTVAMPIAGVDKMLDCTPASSLLYTKGEHLANPATAFDATSEAPKVAAFIELYAAAKPECMDVGGAAVTPSIVFQLGANSVDLSTLGPGLVGATLTFDASTVGGGLYLSAMTLTAGADGLHIVHPRFETCPGGTLTPANDSFSLVDVTVAAAAQQTLGQGTYTLIGVAVGDKFGISFDAITPAAGEAGPAVDNGGACAP